MKHKSGLIRVIAVVVFFALFAFQAMGHDQQQNNPPPPPPPPPAANQAPPPGQAPPGPPPAPMTHQQLDQLVSRIALYPDPLLAQILTASTYSDDIPAAAQWADEHANLKGDALSDAMQQDNLQWDPSVMALLPFPSVLDMMAQDQGWTQELGDAVLAQRGDVMDAVQRMRKKAYQYGYLRTSPYDTVVDSGGYVEILPVNPAYMYPPVYSPAIVFAAPRPGFFIGGAIGFGPAVVIGAGFFPFGWAHPYFGWRDHAIFFDNHVWGRTWVNRRYYVHPYAHPYVRRPGPMVEHHQVQPRGHNEERGGHGEHDGNDNRH
jgi:hypothetical protein